MQATSPQQPKTEVHGPSFLDSPCAAVNTSPPLYQSASAQYTATLSLLATSRFLAPAGTQPRNPSPLIRSSSSTKAARCLQFYSPRVPSLTLLYNPSAAPHRQLTDVFLVLRLDLLSVATLTAEKAVSLLSFVHCNVNRRHFLVRGASARQNSASLSLDQPAFSCYW